MLVTDGFGARGGIARYNQQMVESLARDGQFEEITLLTRHGGGPIPQFGIKVHQPPQASRGKSGYLYASLRELAARRAPHLVICGHINLLPVAAALAGLRAVPLLLSLHGIEGWQPPQSRIARRLLARCDRVLCVSAVTRERFLAWSRLAPERVRVVLNAIDLSAYGPAAAPEHLAERHGLHGCRVILTMGRLDGCERAKGFDEIMDALPDLLRIDGRIRYLIVGDGNDRARLQEKARALGIEGQVIFTGWVAEEEKADYFRMADAYVMPSRMEGFGYVLAEALACGIPVVGSRIDGSADALDGGRLGELVDPDDRASLEAAILRALARPKQVPAGMERFSLDRYDRELHALLSEMIDSPNTTNEHANP